MQGKVAIAGEASYEGARQVFNGAVDRRPTLFAFCESARDVQQAVRATRAYGLPLSVRGGGHDWVGRALSHHGLVVDLSRMRQVEVDVRGRVATVAGGALAGDVIAAAGPHGLAAVTGAAGTVGLAGLLTGGGYGPLLPRFGLALDNLLGAEIVLADGQIVFVDSSQNSELFWAIRGGGGNFGVVTSMLVRLHPIEKVLAGFILFPLAEAMSVLTGYCKFASSAPEELSVIGGIVSAPDGKPCVLLAPKRVDVNGTSFVYRETGEKNGIPIVLLHHLTAVLDDWDPRTIDSLAQKHRVIAFNNRGVGGSKGTTPDTIDDMATDAVAFIRALGLSKTDLLGFSLGGFIAQVIAQKHPDLVRRMILAGTSAAGGEGISNVASVLQNAVARATAEKKHPKQSLFFTQSQDGQKAAAEFLQRLGTRQQDRD
jgi:FAD/FMN-containing dehydrogenase